MKTKTIAGLLALSVLGAALGPTSAQADAYAYAATGDNYFGIVDLTTGVFNPLGNMGLRFSGIGVGPGGALYGGLGTTKYSINPTNGAVTEVCQCFGAGYWTLGSTTAGLFAIGNDRYLYMNETQIGPTGLGNALSTGGSTLYESGGANLYTINTTTGAETFLGGSGGGIYDSLVVEGGIIYGATTTGAIYTLDGSNGAATFLSNVSGTNSPFWGLAPCDACANSPRPIAGAPGPIAGAGLPGLLLFGGGLLVWWRNRRTRKGLCCFRSA